MTETMAASQVYAAVASRLPSDMLLALLLVVEAAAQVTSVSRGNDQRYYDALMCGSSMHHCTASEKAHAGFCWCRCLMRSPPSASSSMFSHRRSHISFTDVAKPDDHSFCLLTHLDGFSVTPTVCVCVIMLNDRFLHGTMSW